MNSGGLLILVNLTLVAGLFGAHNGPLITSDLTIITKQNESSKSGHLFCTGPHDGFQQPNPARCNQHIGTDTNSQVFDRNMAKESEFHISLRGVGSSSKNVLFF